MSSISKGYGLDKCGWC